LKPFLSLTANSPCDNVLLEWVVALELRNQAPSTGPSSVDILPIVMGEPCLDDIGRPRFEPFWTYYKDIQNKLPEVVVQSVVDKASAFLASQDMEASDRMKTMTVKGVVENILTHLGINTHDKFTPSTDHTEFQLQLDSLAQSCVGDVHEIIDKKAREIDNAAATSSSTPRALAKKLSRRFSRQSESKNDATDTANISEVGMWLKSINLEFYTDIFQKNGYLESLDFLASMTAEDVEDLKNECEMKKPHFKRFVREQKTLRDARAVDI